MTFDEILALVSRENSLRVCTDSRLVRAGDIFVAVKGTVYDGHNFIDKALDNGAEYIVCRQPYQCRDAEVIIVKNSAEAAALLAQAARGNPASHLISLAVTGTNGKTTVAFLVRSVIENAGEKCGLVGTVIYDTGSAVSKATLTTPDSLAVAEMTGQMVNAGTKYIVIEASSHALSQDRLAGINFKAAAFTNLTGDHLDYHKTEKEYLAAKSILFKGLSAGSTAVLNKQSPHSVRLAGETRAGILWYAIEDSSRSSEGRGSSADITAHIESMDMAGTVFVLEYAGQKQKVKSPLIGRYNISNHLAATGLSLAAGFDLETIAAGLSVLRKVPGRLERVNWCGDFTVLIDYAHTDDALKNVLSTLRPLCKGRLVVVFGCGGDRDRTKRPRMAKIAEQLADFVIVTSDNPRNEQPEDIINEIVAGFEKGSATSNVEFRATSDERRATKIIEPDRKKAIESALGAAAKNDIVLIAGKGHETYQIIGDKKIDFSDLDIAKNCLKKRIQDTE